MTDQESPAVGARVPRRAPITAGATRSPVPAPRPRTTPPSASASEKESTQESTMTDTIEIRLDEVRHYGGDAAVAAALYRAHGSENPEPVAAAMGTSPFVARLSWTHLRRRGWALDPTTDTPAPAGRPAAPRGNRTGPRVGEGRTA